MKILKKILVEFDYLDPYINDNNDNHDDNNLKQKQFYNNNITFLIIL